jgi:predicted Zn-dependent peptidase
MSNIENITREDIKKYFYRNYSAKNMIIGVIGDIYPDKLKELANKYFSKIRSGQKIPPIFTREPKQAGEKTMKIFEDSQPWLVIGYHIPSVSHEDYLKFEILNYLLTQGRSSRLYKKMVVEEKSSLFTGSLTGYPGRKYAGLFIIYTLPNQDFSNKDLQKVIFQEIDDLKKKPVSENELRSAKTRYKINLLRQMKAANFFLIKLIEAKLLRGSWEKVFEDLERMPKITANDIQNLAKKYFTDSNRVILRIEKKREKIK